MLDTEVLVLYPRLKNKRGKFEMRNLDFSPNVRHDKRLQKFKTVRLGIFPTPRQHNKKGNF
jgi:hypothetical protein